MTTHPEFEDQLASGCEKLRRAGLSEGRIQDFATRWRQIGSAAELEETGNRLGALDVGKDDEQRTLAFNEFMSLMTDIEEIVRRPEVRVLLSSKVPNRPPTPRYPDIQVNIADLDSEIWPILRRVSYAMSDAGLSESEIEQYKDEVRRSNDPIGVSARWVQVA